MTMLEKTIAHMAANREQPIWTLDELRRAAGIALRSQYRLSEQLGADPRVERKGGRMFALAA